VKLLKATMPTITPTTLDQISAEKTKVSERLARLDTDHATVATQLTDLETAERVLMRVSKTPPTRRTKSAAAAEAKAPTATRGRGRPPKAATSKSAGREPNAPSLGERVLALATGRTRQELYVACPNDRPNHIGIAVQRHLRAGRIQERDDKLYATSPAAQATA
jgi:AT hook motif